MNIRELIQKLERIDEKHGNLKCVTPGFNEVGMDDILIVKCVNISEEESPNTACAKYGEAKKESKQKELAVFIE